MNRVRVTGIIKHQLDAKEVRSTSDRELILNYLYDESRILKGYAEKVYYPYTEKHVRDIIEYANKNKVKVTISGAGTGITGSRVPLGGVILSTEYMTQVSEIDRGEVVRYSEGGFEYSIVIGRDYNTGDYYAIAPPGIPLSILDKILSIKGLYYPPDPTEKTALLGGTVATNASGARSFYYGATRDYIRRLRIILPNGYVIEVRRGVEKVVKYKFYIEGIEGDSIEVEIPKYKMPNVRKNAAGYYVKSDMDLIDLFIGSEGTLGVFTEIEIKLIERPKYILPIYICLKEDRETLDLVRELRSHVFEGNAHLLSIEYYDKHSVRFLIDKYGSIIPSETGAILYIELEGDEDSIYGGLEDIDDILDMFEIVKVLTSFDVDWLELSREIRHYLPTRINEYIMRYGLRKVASDIAVPDDSMDKMMDTYIEVGEKYMVPYVLFGHIGDNHLHFNFLPRNSDELNKAYRGYTDLILKAIELGGTVTAEHGVGKKKCLINDAEKPLLEVMYGRDGILQAARMKNTLDPNHILNIGNIVPEEYLEMVR